jgi:hypothetical protein
VSSSSMRLGRQVNPNPGAAAEILDLTSSVEVKTCCSLNQSGGRWLFAYSCTQQLWHKAIFTAARCCGSLSAFLPAAAILASDRAPSWPTYPRQSDHRRREYDRGGQLIAADHIYRAAKPDGLSIGHFIGGLFLQQLLGKSGIEFDAQI